MHVKSAADTVVSALPCPHVYGNVVFNGAMMYGHDPGAACRASTRARCSRSIQAHRATMFEGVPTMYHVHAGQLAEFDRHDLSSLTRCTVGGQTMPVAKMQEVERRLGCPLIELWGMTELAGLGTTFPCHGHDTLRLDRDGAADCRGADRRGRPMPARTLPAGEVGELMIKGPIVMRATTATRRRPARRSSRTAGCTAAISPRMDAGG